MIIKQLSIELQDQTGATWQVFQLLADSGLNILSYSINDYHGHGILRLIVDDVHLAQEAFAAAKLQVELTDVYCLNVPNERGSMSKVLRWLNDNGVSLDFLYAFQYKGLSQAIMRAADMERLTAVMRRYELNELNANAAL